jgi:hypothetical protein
MKTQVNIRMDVTLKKALEEHAKQQETSVTDLIERYIRKGLAQERGEVVEEQSLPALREMVSTELRRAQAQFRLDIREDLEHEVMGPMREMTKRHDDRLASLTVHAIREAGLARRILYAFVGRAVSEEFARVIFTGAKEAVGRDLSSNRKGDPYQ